MTIGAKTPAESLAETLEKVACGGVEPEAAPTPAAAAILKAAALSNAGGIQRYRDAQGVWHIDNVTAENEDAGPVGLEAGKTPAAEIATIETPPRRPAAVKAAPPVQKVAWTQDYPDLATLPTSKTKVKRAAAPETPTLIRRYRDSKGQGKLLVPSTHSRSLHGNRCLST